jgi:hypothetical protein
MENDLINLKSFWDSGSELMSDDTWLDPAIKQLIYILLELRKTRVRIWKIQRETIAGH